VPAVAHSSARSTIRSWIEGQQRSRPALRLTTDAAGLFTNAPNLIMVLRLTRISSTVVGGTISGGGGNDNSGNPYPNNVTAEFGTVGGELAMLPAAPRHL